MKESREDIMRILKETRARIAMKRLLLSDHILGRISYSDISKEKVVQLTVMEPGVSI